MKKLPDPDFFIRFIQELLPEGQHEYLCFWASVFLRSLRAGDFRPGQFIVLAGEHGCGKSLQQYMLTEIFGGRAANPFEYLMGEEKFNKDLAGAEHWAIEDPRGSTDIRTRRDFGARLKEATVNRDIRIRAMNKDGVLVRIARRISISVNMELEYLSVLPPFDPSLSDKGMLFLCSPVREALKPFWFGGELSREKIWENFTSEIPAIRQWLLREFIPEKIPTALRDERFIVKAWHHPQLISELSSLTHESRLLELIDEAYFPKRDKDGKLLEYSETDSLRNVPAGDVQNRLLEHNRFEAEKVLRYPGACGSHLGKLSKSAPERVSRRILDGKTLWTIKPPPQIEDKDQNKLDL